MPLVATPATPYVISVDEVRRFMRDYPDKNQLLDTVDFSQEDVNQGIEMVVSSYNTITPVSFLSPAAWPANGKYLLLLGVTAYLMQSNGFLQIRNQLTYQDGDIAPIGEFDKFPLRGRWRRPARQHATGHRAPGRAQAAGLIPTGPRSRRHTPDLPLFARGSTPRRLAPAAPACDDRTVARANNSVRAPRANVAFAALPRPRASSLQEKPP